LRNSPILPPLDKVVQVAFANRAIGLGICQERVAADQECQLLAELFQSSCERVDMLVQQGRHRASAWSSPALNLLQS
jgi:hypothetical protein